MPLAVSLWYLQPRPRSVSQWSWISAEGKRLYLSQHIGSGLHMRYSYPVHPSQSVNIASFGTIYLAYYSNLPSKMGAPGVGSSHPTALSKWGITWEIIRSRPNGAFTPSLSPSQPTCVSIREAHPRCLMRGLFWTWFLFSRCEFSWCYRIRCDCRLMNGGMKPTMIDFNLWTSCSLLWM